MSAGAERLGITAQFDLKSGHIKLIVVGEDGSGLVCFLSAPQAEQLLSQIEESLEKWRTAKLPH